MLLATHRGILGSTLVVEDEGAKIAEVHSGSFLGNSRILIGDDEYWAVDNGWFKIRISLYDKDQNVVATAEGSRSKCHFKFQDSGYFLKPPPASQDLSTQGAYPTEYYFLYDSRCENIVGKIYRAHSVFKSKFQIHLPDELPSSVKAFMLLFVWEADLSERSADSL